MSHRHLNTNQSGLKRKSSLLIFVEGNIMNKIVTRKLDLSNKQMDLLEKGVQGLIGTKVDERGEAVEIATLVRLIGKAKVVTVSFDEPERRV